MPLYLAIELTHLLQRSQKERLTICRCCECHGGSPLPSNDYMIMLPYYYFQEPLKLKTKQSFPYPARRDTSRMYNPTYILKQI